PAAEQTSSRGDDQLAPAWEAGIEPGDEITAIAGVETQDWDQLSRVIKDHAGQRVEVDFIRDGRAQSVTVPIIASERQKLDEADRPLTNPDGTPQTVTEGFFGVGPVFERDSLPIGEFPGAVWDQVSGVFHAIITLPVKLVDIGEVAVGSKDRDAEGLVGM